MGAQRLESKSAGPPEGRGARSGDEDAPLCRLALRADRAKTKTGLSACLFELVSNGSSRTARSAMCVAVAYPCSLSALLVSGPDCPPPGTPSCSQSGAFAWKINMSYSTIMLGEVGVSDQRKFGRFRRGALSRLPVIMQCPHSSHGLGRRSLRPCRQRSGQKSRVQDDGVSHRNYPVS